MTIDFGASECQSHSNNKLFGLCDDPPPARTKAYIDETKEDSWIAIVENEQQHQVTFTAIDHCIIIRRTDGSMDKRCDGMLSYLDQVVFVELKERGGKTNNDWIRDGDTQLRTSISYYEATDDAKGKVGKKAYIANKKHPEFRSGQMSRMDRFLTDTGYVLRVENKITLP